VVDVVLLFPLTFLVGGLIIAAMAMSHRARLRELAYRERIAMIERGLTPAPETDPARFEQTLERWVSSDAFARAAGHRHRTFGVMLIGLGFGLMLLIGVTAGFANGMGIGGAVVCLGVAFLVNGILEARAAPSAPRRPSGARAPDSLNPEP
jgi:hypothetical protein